MAGMGVQAAAESTPFEARRGVSPEAEAPGHVPLFDVVTNASLAAATARTAQGLRSLPRQAVMLAER
jgi:hypothetical protein